MMEWGVPWNQTDSWGKGAGNKVCEGLDQALGDAEEALLGWGEALLKRGAQGADKREKLSGWRSRSG